MKRSSKRLWSVLLTLAMLLSIAPVSAYAAGPWWDWLVGGGTEPYGETSYDAYYYVLDPTVSDQDSRKVENFIFIGRGSVSSRLGAPDSGYNEGGTVSINDRNRGYMIVPEQETQRFGSGSNQVVWTTYPDITHNNKVYTYSGKDNPGDSTYSIVWYRYSSSTGYNIYDRENNQNYPFDERNYCWHVDGRIEFSDKVSVTYLVYFPGDSTPSSVTSGGNYTDSATYTSYKKEGTAFSEFGKPNMSNQIEDSERNKYTFKGWYYDKDCTEPIGNDAVISESITAYGKYEKIDESKPSSITVEVYVDGNKETLTDDNLRQYLTDISVAQGTLDDGEVTVSGNGSLTVPFKYSVYDAVDLKISLNENYELQGAAGSFIYGEGWRNPMFDGGGWIIDNIDGGSTLKLYLNTLYSVKYYLDGSETEDPSDTEKYVTGQGVNETTITAGSFNPEQRDAAVEGTLRNPSLNYELELEGVPAGYTGWYKTAGGDTKHTVSYKGEAIADAAQNSGEATPTIIECFGKTVKAPGLSVEKSVVSVGGVEVTGEEIPAAIADDVIEYEIVITNTGNTELTGINVSDSLWTAGMTINVGGEVESLTDTAYLIDSLDAGKELTITYSYTVKETDTSVKNTVTASASGIQEIKDEVTVGVNGAVTITPADITIYMGGDGGYDAVVGTDGNATISNSMPRPLFYVSVPEGTDPDNLTLKGNDDREWRFEEAGLDANRVSLFYINSTGYGDQDPVRVQYSRDGEVYVEDEFDPAVVQELYTEYDISIYSGRVTSVWAEFKIGSITTRHSVASETGTLRVRAVEDGGEDKNPVVDVTTMPPAGPLQPGEAAITAPKGTTYTLNDTTVSVDAEGVGLLFDGIIDTDADRTGALIAAIESKFNTDSSYWNYQAQYLDLVDALNGNAWVMASDNVTVYWAYPEGTDKEDDFVLYHFKGLHRDGENSGFDIGDIAKTEIETVTITKTEQGISFEVTPGGFSPFVLLSHAKTGAELGGITGIEKQLVTARDKYAEFRLSCPDFSGGKVFVERYGKVTLLYSITVSGTPGTAYVVEDAGAVVKEGSLSGVIGADGKAVVYVAKTFDWNDVRTGSLKNTATVEYNDGTSPEDDSDTVETEVVVYDPVTPPVRPAEPEYKPDGLNTKDHFAYIIGYEDGTVRPNGSITRAEVATIFFRLLTDEARDEFSTDANSYTDVSRGDWYNTAVSTLSRLGILGGYEDGTFRPNSGITRAEFAKIAVSFFEYEGIEAENVFTDVAHGSWYEDFVAAAAEIGLIEGYEDGSFRPESGITRAEACTIINRTLGRAPDKGHLLPESEMLTWPDNPESAWYYAQIQEATNSHEYKWLGAIEQWLEKLPERDWAA